MFILTFEVKEHSKMKYFVTYLQIVLSKQLQNCEHGTFLVVHFCINYYVKKLKYLLTNKPHSEQQPTPASDARVSARVYRTAICGIKSRRRCCHVLLIRVIHMRECILAILFDSFTRFKN